MLNYIAHFLLVFTFGQHSHVATSAEKHYQFEHLLIWELSESVLNLQSS